MEEDPKQVAKNERKTPQVERLLRQFLKVDGPKGNTPEYENAYERVFGNSCGACDGYGTTDHLWSGPRCDACDGTGKRRPEIQPGDGQDAVPRER